MARGGTGFRRWALAGAGAVLIAAGLAALFRMPTEKPAAPRVAASNAKVPLAPVGIARLGEGSGDELLREEAMLRDPTPLFLPTRWNASEVVLPDEAQREPGGSFTGYRAWFKFDPGALVLDLPAPVRVPEKPAEAFGADTQARPLAGFGETDLRVEPLAVRPAFVEVAAAGSGRRVLAQPLADARPPAEAGWQPLEFLMAVDPAGVVRPPVLMVSSRAGAVDNYFQEYLVSAFHIGERLGPGIYRVNVGP